MFNLWITITINTWLLSSHMVWFFVYSVGAQCYRWKRQQISICGLHCQRFLPFVQEFNRAKKDNIFNIIKLLHRKEDFSWETYMITLYAKRSDNPTTIPFRMVSLALHCILELSFLNWALYHCLMVDLIRILGLHSLFRW